MKYLPVCLLMSIWIIMPDKCQAQEFIYKAGYFGFFDNREYFNEYVNDQTIFGSRIYGEVGYAFNNNNRMMAGANYLYEFGSKGELIAPDITAYYSGRYRNFSLSIGAFPRIDKIIMPMALMSDTFQYYRPNAEGIFMEYNTGHFRHNVWIDWVSRQSEQKRESFLLGFSGFVKSGLFIYQHHAVMTHLAHSLSDSVDEPIRDNAGFSVLPGLDLTSVTSLDTLTISAGILFSYDRIRGVYDFRFPAGFLAEMEVMHKGFGIHGTLYAGESQVITSGDGFYKSTFYSRLDAFFQVSTRNIGGRVQFSCHFVPGVVDLSMSLLIRANLDGVFGNHQSN